MDEVKSKLAERQKRRYRILRTLFDGSIQADKNPSEFIVSPNSLGQYLELDPSIVKMELDYLSGEYLVEEVVGMSDPLESHFKIAHLGVVEVERSIENPNSSTEHFMVTVVQHFNAPVGTVQNASHSVAHVTQTIGFDPKDVLKLVSELQQQLGDVPEEKREDVADDLVLLENALAKDKPDEAQIKVLVRRLKRVGDTVGSSVKFASTLTTLLAKLREMNLL